MIRLFVALSLPLAVRQHLALLSGGVPGARWTAIENFHLTLRFIGEVEGGVAEDIAAALALVDAPAFELVIAGVDQFGKGDRSRILWAGIEPNPALVHLRDKVESALVRAGVPPETRKFSAHISLARLRDAPADRVAQFIQTYQGLRIGPLAVESLSLYSSWQQASGPIYREEAGYALTPV
jgi:2'-5' RNA ligase